MLRRSQILLQSAERERASAIATMLGCGVQTVRNAIHAFNEQGVPALDKRSSRRHHPNRSFEANQAEQLRALLHQSPRTFGKPSSLWTLELAAQVSYEQGLTATQVSGETIRATLARLSLAWQRAKHWISSPDPAYARKKNARDRLIRLTENHTDFALGFADETWWSRLRQPNLHSWTAGQPLRLHELARPPADTEPKALAGYGLLLRHGQLDERVWLRFVSGRPISALTIQFLEWSCQQLQDLGLRALFLIWDNASWHKSQRVRQWIREHNQHVKRTQRGVRLIVCPLPIKSPWLNPTAQRCLWH